MSRVKRFVLRAVTFPFIGLFRIAHPLRRAWIRFSGLAQARALFSGVVPVSTQFDSHIHVSGTRTVSLGECCRLGRDVFFETHGGGRITLGSHVRINAGTVLVSYASVIIGDGTLIGEYASIRDADHGTAPGQEIRLQQHLAAPIYIGRDVWIGRGVAVLKGVSIGDGAIVGANSVVTHDVPPGVLVAGSPAVVIRLRS